MKYVFTAMIAVVALMFAAAPATADWNPDDPHKMHFPQIPDLLNGMNVLASSTVLDDIPVQKVLADDFRCTETGRITDIHIWGSWLGDLPPIDPDDPNGVGPSPGNVGFRLSIHKDIPKDESTTEYSMPGISLWDRNFEPGEFQWRFWANSTEDFFDPNLNDFIGFDSKVYQYNFLIPEAEAFPQEEGTIYWLSVTALPGPIAQGAPLAVFGWKTSDNNWNDDAVYWDVFPDGAHTSPQELINLQGESLDMAFVITPEPGTVAMLIGAGLVGLLAYGRRRRKG